MKKAIKKTPQKTKTNPHYEKYNESNGTLVGVKRKSYTDNETGEVIDVDQITKKAYGYKAFLKVFLLDFLKVLGILESKQLDVLIYILENLNPYDNTFIGTYSKIQEEVGVSSATLCSIMKKLQSCFIGDLPAITKIQNGVWRVNPNLIMKGNDTKRNILLSIQREEYEEKHLSVKTEKKKITPPPMPPLFPEESETEKFSELPF